MVTCGQHRLVEGLDEAAHLLDACHDRFCTCIETLRKLPLWVSEHGADATARDAARAVLRHFRGEALRHYDDEERHVFPRLLERAGKAERWAVAELVQLLEADHRRLREGWDAIVGRIEAVAAGEAHSLAAGEVHEFVLKLVSHIECERLRLLPLMQRLLLPGDQDEIGAELRARRLGSGPDGVRQAG